MTSRSFATTLKVEGKTQNDHRTLGHLINCSVLPLEVMVLSREIDIGN